MNAVEIEEAVTALALEAFDASEFPFAFLQAFGNKDTTLKKLRTGASNKSDVGGVLQTRNIHLKVAEASAVTFRRIDRPTLAESSRSRTPTEGPLLLRNS